MLGLLGHSVLAAAGGRQGLARLQAGDAVDLVLTDLNMPEVSGWDVIKAVKEGWPSLPIGVITWTPEALLKQRGEPLDCVLFKPVTLHTLQEAISQLRP